MLNIRSNLKALLTMYLTQIHGLKEELEFKDTSGNFGWQVNLEKKATEAQSIFYTAKPPDLLSVLRALPDRAVTDRLLSFYFNSKFFAVRKSISGTELGLD